MVISSLKSALRFICILFCLGYVLKQVPVPLEIKKILHFCFKLLSQWGNLQKFTCKKIKCQIQLIKTRTVYSVLFVQLGGNLRF